MPTVKRVHPRNFFLNETHELASIEKEGGGRTTGYVGVSWAQKATTISRSIAKTIKQIKGSKDPLRDDRLFVLARPVDELEKQSADKRKAPSGTYKDKPNFGGSTGRAFDRLGLDLLQVTDGGDAVVHGTKDRIEQLFRRATDLEALGVREQSRWVAIDHFETVPFSLRVDEEWLGAMAHGKLIDAVFELPPVLGRVDADRVLRAIAQILRRDKGEKLTGNGMDFSGRYWFRGQAQVSSLRSVADDFFSVQSIHSPLFATTAARPKLITQTAVAPRNPVQDRRTLPCVAVLDLGVPSDHVHLSAYRRGQFIPQGALGSSDDHGSFVTSRVVFGDHPDAESLAEATARCSFYDVLVGDGNPTHVDDKLVLPGLAGVRGAAPDVRVFNLSFGYDRPLSSYPPVERREHRLQMQDLDNFAFANDVLIVIAAGNSPAGLIPGTAYPNHHEDERWGLGPWACGFNSVVCGSYVSQLSAGGLVKVAGYPSPFSRLGPGLCDAPVPTFGAPGGNGDENYGISNGLGVWGYSGSGMAEDRIGTSQAAPIIAREAALSFAHLQKNCLGSAVPFAVTVRAFLAINARSTSNDASIEELKTRALGLGRTAADELVTPASGKLLIFWQGIIESAKDIVRIQLPIPEQWLTTAEHPKLRLMVCSDPPVNEASTASWACRRVNITLHTGPEARGLRGSGREHENYPLYSRVFDLRKHASGEKKAEGDLWLLLLVEN